MLKIPSRIHITAILLALIEITSHHHAHAGTTFKFIKPTDTSPGSTKQASVWVPNDIVINEIDNLDQQLDEVIANVFESANGLTLRSHQLDFPNPVVTLTGSGTNVVVKIAGLDLFKFSATYRPSGFLGSVCGSLSGDVTANGLSVRIVYDYYTGTVVESSLSYTRLNVDLGCSNFFGDLFLSIADIFLDWEDIAADFIRDFNANSANLINARFQNLLSLQDALRGASQVGLREVRQLVDDSLMILGGVRSAAACFIANKITQDLIARLRLTSSQEIDELRERLEDLPLEIGRQIADFDPTLVGDALYSYLLRNLPDVKDFLLDKLEDAYDIAVGVVEDLERIAVRALTNLVRINWAQLFGGVNVRARVDRNRHIVTLDAFHTGPSSFVATAEAVAPCVQTHRIPIVANANQYIIYNTAGSVVYRGGHKSQFTSVGFLWIKVKNSWGLVSYGKRGDVRLVGWGDYEGSPSNFRWPQCPVHGAPRPVPRPRPRPRPRPVPRPAPRPVPRPVPVPRPAPRPSPTRPAVHLP